MEPWHDSQEDRPLKKYGDPRTSTELIAGRLRRMGTATVSHEAIYNGLIQRYIPKGTDIEKITEEEIRYIEWQLNNRPRKCLGYQTPAEVFDKLCGALAP